MQRHLFARSCTARGLAIIVTAVLASASVFAQTPQAPTFTIGKLDAAAEGPVIDGRVNEAVWQAVQPYTSFTQQDPIEGAPASEKTEVRIIVGTGTVYVSVIAFDSDPSKIIVSQARRDASLSETDSVVMVFDTFNDNQNAFVFGTNPLGIEYDGQVAREGQTSGVQVGGGGAAGTQRGGISAFNPNWDGDWTVKSQITERGWETELAIPLKTLRYQTGTNRTWGFNVLRNIRHKNEQVYLAPIPRGYDIYRVSLAAKISGLDLPARRDIKLIPYALGSVNKDYTRSGDQVDKNGDVGLDVKWGIRPNLTLDATINTDFAQVEADEEQVNLTRFDLFFPEKRPFFLENASTFQFGNPQQIDLFFSRRVGLSPAALPIDIRGGARLSGKLGGWNVGVLNIQADNVEDARGTIVGAANNFGVVRVQREVGRSSYGAIFVNRQGTGAHSIGDDYNRAYGVDANIQISGSQRFSAFVARTPTRRRTAPSARAAAITPAGPSTISPTTSGRSRVATRRSAPTSIPKWAFCRGAGIAVLSSAHSFSRSPRRSSGSAASRRTSYTTHSGGSTRSCRPSSGTSTRSKFNPSRGGGLAISLTTPRTIPHGLSRCSTATGGG